MKPSDLKPESFDSYPQQARGVAVAHLALLQKLPLSLLLSLLREVIDYDDKFPAERASVDRELAQLEGMTPEQLQERVRAFSEISLSSQMENIDWVRQPLRGTEHLSTYLWSTHQIDAFRKAALDYGDRLQASKQPDPPPLRRLGIAVVGQGVPVYQGQLFRKLRPHGTLFTHVRSDNGIAHLVQSLEARAAEHPQVYGHWYIDGGRAESTSAGITSLSYQSIDPLRTALLRYMQSETQRPGMGPEELRTHLAQLCPRDLDTAAVSGDPVMDRFRLSLLTEGSGTQIYSTTFVQWSAREALRRAQALTLFVRFAPRQHQRPMNELLSGSGSEEYDFAGSLTDAEMGAYYTWINQQRLAGADQSVFLAWFEGHDQAMVIAPTLPRGAISATNTDLRQLLSWALA